MLAWACCLRCLYVCVSKCRICLSLSDVSVFFVSCLCSDMCACIVYDSNTLVCAFACVCVCLFALTVHIVLVVWLPHMNVLCPCICCRRGCCCCCCRLHQWWCYCWWIKLYNEQTESYIRALRWCILYCLSGFLRPIVRAALVRFSALVNCKITTKTIISAFWLFLLAS